MVRSAILVLIILGFLVLPAAGSTFSLFPPDNATGNFIHIAERVPVRIGLNADELRKNPLQPGLSTLTRIRISEPGEALQSSFIRIFQFLLEKKVKLSSEFMVFGIYLITLYLALEEGAFEHSIKALFLESESAVADPELKEDRKG